MFQYAWVMPNSSARCAQLPRAVDKVPFYTALKKFRDYLRGEVPDLDEAEVVFPEVGLVTFFLFYSIFLSSVFLLFHQLFESVCHSKRNE